MNSAAKTMDLVCLGEPMVEFNQTNGKDWTQGFGGDTSNCAISAARQNAKVGYITKLGVDHFGDQLVDLWQSEGIDTAQVIRDPHAQTGVYFVSHDTSGHHYTYYRKHSAASTILPGDLLKSYIASAKVLHVSAISQAISATAAETVSAAIDIANQNNTLVAYDTNLRLNLWEEERARQTIHSAMSSCDIALPSYDDATVLTGLDEPNAIVDFYLALGASMVVLKCGGDGSVVATQNSREKVPGLQVASIDANGAGDAFAGAFLTGIANGAGPFEAARYANYAAALSTTRAGAVTAIPQRDEVERFIQEYS